MPELTNGAQDAGQAASGRLTLIRVLVLLAVIGLSVYIFSIRDEAERFAAYGYPGIFLISLLANATILLPRPGVAIVFAMGSVFEPALVALAAGLGATVGEISAYAAGFSGQAVIERTAVYAADCAVDEQIWGVDHADIGGRAESVL